MNETYQIRRVLYPYTAEQRGHDIPDTVRRLGLDALTCDIPCGNGDDSPSTIDRFSEEIASQGAEAVMTHGFLLAPAVACARQRIPYLAWIWDAPDMGLYHEAAQLPTSFIFDFDRLQAAESALRGCPHVFHFPLSANAERMGALQLTEEDRRRFGCDISFIGALYSEAAYRLPAGVEEGVRDAVERVISEMLGRWDGVDRMSDRLTDAEIGHIAAAMEREGRLGADIPLPLVRRSLEMKLLSRRAGYYERREMLERLSRYDLQCYTVAADLSEEIPGVEVRPPLHYYKETPKAYALSRINLNLTLHSIRSGVPLRVFDILGAGGFLLSSWQPELEELFDVGRELETFRSWEELEDKVAYYLNHEEERERIALRGYLRVCEYYTYDKAIARMLAIVGRHRRFEGEVRLQ